MCLLWISKGQLDYAQSPPQESAIRVETRQVLVPVIVKDRKGHYVRDLTADELHVFDDGAEQKIVAFIPQASGPSGYFRPQAVDSGPPQVESFAPPAGGKGLSPSTYLVCLDTLNSAFSNYVHVRTSLEKLFRGLEASDARYGLVTVNRHVRLIRNLTSDPAVILAALDDKALTGEINQSQTIRQGEDEVQLSQMLHRYCGNCDCMSGRDPESKTNGGGCISDWQSMEGWAGAQAEQRRVAALDFLNNLRGIVERLGEVPGRRIVIFVSDGFNIQPGRELYGLMAAYTRAQGVMLHNTTADVEPEVQSVVRAAQLRDVAFYTLDSRGVYMVPAGEMNTPAVMAPFPSSRRTTDSDLGPLLASLQSDRQTIAKDNQSALQQLAGETGGDFFENSNDLTKGLREAIDDGGAYYLLAYTPSHLIADGRFHRIKVEVDRRDVAIRAKQGYFAPTPVKVNEVAETPPSSAQRAAPAANLPAGASNGAAASRGAAATGGLPAPNSASPSPPANPGSSQQVGIPGQAQPAPVLIIDWPLAQLKHVIPQLENIRPAESQEALPGILDKIGRNVTTFTQSVPNLSSQEEITEEQLKKDGKVSKQFTEKFEYLVLADRQPSGVTLREYRTDASGKQVKPVGLTKGYMVTSGDFSSVLCFLPGLQAAASFRLLGEQSLDGRGTYVVIFAQRSGSAGPSGLLRSLSGDKSVGTFLQGIAWIDAGNFQIVRLRTDVFPPPSDANVWRLVSDIHYGEIHFEQLATPLWVPDNIVVTMSMADRMWRDQHHYTGFRLFTVDSKMVPAPMP